MLLTEFEYIFLRLIRKFLIKDSILIKVGKWIPYYITNQNQKTSSPIVDKYEESLGYLNTQLTAKSILEIGIGATNSTGYEITARNKNVRYWGYEPFVEYNSRLDNRIYKKDISMRLTNAYDSMKNVTRISTLKNIENNTIDIILSNSVLEHVVNMDTLLVDLKRVLKEDGCMIHIVDYRDHFFKYPFHFLKYSKSVWDRYLNPGDLPRWRVCQHMRLFNKHGFSAEIIHRELSEDQYLKVEKHLDSEFKKIDRQSNFTTSATLYVRHAN